MKKALFLFIIVSIAICGTTSVVIDLDSPSFESSQGVNSAKYIQAPIQQIDEDTVVFFPYYNRDPDMDPSADTIWIASKFSKRYFGFNEDSSGYEKTGLPINDSVVIGNVNDSIWAGEVYWEKYRNGDGFYMDSVFHHTRWKPRFWSLELHGQQCFRHDNRLR